MCARGSNRALLGGPSTSPLDTMQILIAKPPALLGALTLVIGAGVFGSGCVSKDDLTVWKAEALSPDGKWIASADTVQNGGFGSADISTSVYLRRAGDSRPPVRVLEFSCQGPMPHPYVLDNAANAGGSIHLALKWLDQSHLHVSYDEHPKLLFQAVTLQDVSITIADFSIAGGARKQT